MNNQEEWWQQHLRDSVKAEKLRDALNSQHEIWKQEDILAGRSQKTFVEQPEIESRPGKETALVLLVPAIFGLILTAFFVLMLCLILRSREPFDELYERLTDVTVYHLILLFGVVAIASSFFLLIARGLILSIFGAE